MTKPTSGNQPSPALLQIQERYRPLAQVLHLIEDLEHWDEERSGFWGHRVVDEEELLLKLSQLKSALPAALRAAEQLAAQAPVLMDRCDAESQALVARARQSSEEHLDAARGAAATLIGATQRRHDAMMADARTEADRILHEARQQAEQLVAEENIVRQARERAAATVEAAEQAAAEVRREGDEEAYQTLEELGNMLIVMRKVAMKRAPP